LNNPIVVWLWPDRPVMAALHVHAPLECDQQPCKARAENDGNRRSKPSPRAIYY
jgi:hypothetical protein